MRSLIFALLAIALLVFITACTQKQQGGLDGISINSFSVEPQTAEADDTVRFFTDFENIGGTTARCVLVELYGLDSWRTFEGLQMTSAHPWRDRRLSFSYLNDVMQFSYYDVKNGVDARLSYSKDAGTSLSLFVTNSWNSFLNDFCNSYQDLSSFRDVKFYSSLSPPLPQRNRPGQVQTADWTFRPPVLPEGLRVDYPVTERVSYAYTSTAHINLRAFNKDEFRRRQNIGDTTQYMPDVVNSFGSPIQINLASGSSPIVVNENRIDPIQRENFVIEFQNVGSGFPLASGGLDNGFVFATVEVSGPGVFFDDCLGQRGGTELFDYAITGNLVKIRGGENSARFGCTIGIDRSAWTSTPSGIISLTFNVFYRYSTEREISATVLGLENS